MVEYALDSYPAVVDPASGVLEVRLAIVPDGADRSDPPGWRQLYRLHRLPLAVDLPEGPAEGYHNFGDDEDPDGCRIILGYDMYGILSYIIHEHDGGWKIHDVPEEMIGQVARRPSVRFVFETVDDRKRFLFLLGEIASLCNHSKAVSPKMLDEFFRYVVESPHPPRVVDVGVVSGQ